MDLASRSSTWANTPLRPEPQGHGPPQGSRTFDRDELDSDRSASKSSSIEKAAGRDQAASTSSRPASSSWRTGAGGRWPAGLHHKFGMAVDPADWADVWARPRSSAGSRPRLAQLYARKEAEFPVRVGLTRYPRRAYARPAAPRYDRDGLAAWAIERLQASTSTPRRSARKLRPEIEALLLEVAHKRIPRRPSSPRSSIGGSRRPSAPSSERPSRPARPTPRPLAELAAWAREEFGVEITADELARASAATRARYKLVDALDAKHRPEMREMEKVLVLQILDSSWMEHLRAMDHLRSSVGLQGYAQVDPKVEYKREGMKIFEEMWSGVSDKVTDLIFRVEQFDPDFLSYLGSRWQLDRAQTIHQAARVRARGRRRSASGPQQDAAIAASQ